MNSSDDDDVYNMATPPCDFSKLTLPGIRVFATDLVKMKVDPEDDADELVRKIMEKWESLSKEQKKWILNNFDN